GVVLVDEQIDPAPREALRLVEQSCGEARSPPFGRDDELVEIQGLRIDGNESGQRALALGHHDVRRRDQLVPPALAPPSYALVEIDMRVMPRPRAPPQLDSSVLIGGGVGTEAYVRHFQLQPVIIGLARNAPSPGDLAFLWHRGAILSEMAGTSPAMTLKRTTAPSA